MASYHYDNGKILILWQFPVGITLLNPKRSCFILTEYTGEKNDGILRIKL